MQNLQTDAPILGVHRLGDLAMVLRLFGGGQLRGPLHDSPFRVRRDTARDDQRHPVARTLTIERRQAREAIGSLLKPRVHRAHQHTILERDVAQRQRTEDIRIGSHCGLSLAVSSTSDNHCYIAPPPLSSATLTQSWSSVTGCQDIND